MERRYHKKNVGKNSILKLLSLCTILMAATVIVLLIPRQYVVKGLSMEPTLSEGDSLYYTRFRTLGYGDLVVFQQHEYGLMVKRVIGLPGDHISVNEDGSVIRNGEPLVEPYIEQDALGNSAADEITVEEGKLFVLGDNRAVSIDSRDARIGQISFESVLGSVDRAVRSFD